MPYYFRNLIFFRRLRAKIIFSFALLFSILSLPLYASPSSSGATQEFNLNEILHHHLIDSVLFEFQPFGEKIFEGQKDFIHTNPFLKKHTFYNEQGVAYRYQGGIPLHITRRVAQMLVVSLLLCFLFFVVARRIAANPFSVNRSFIGAFESIFEWIRKDIVDENISSKRESYYPLLATLFFFILFLNLAGLFPPLGEGALKLYHLFSSGGAAGAESHAVAHDAINAPTSDIASSIFLSMWPGITSTGDVSVTLALALITVVLIWYTGFRFQGHKFLWQVVPRGVPLPLYLLLWPLEFLIGPIAKGFALTIRLLANMTAGHVIILALLGFIFQAKSLWLGSLPSVIGALGITIASLGGILGVYLLEIMVSFLQAFIFTLLTALFLGSMTHRH